MKPRLLDLFCGAGGCTKGYQRAGFYVVGVDWKSQPNYCGEVFYQGDALEALTGLLDARSLAGGLGRGSFDVIHASPPCQAHVQWQNLNAERYGSRVEHPDLIPLTRELLEAAGLPYVIENVVGAPLRHPIMLCGSHFGLGVRRHRLFESNCFLMRQPGCRHTGDELAVYGKLDGRRIWTRADASEVRAPRTLEDARRAMGIDWMGWDELREAIPPSYTEAVGHQLMTYLRSQEVAA